MPKKITPFILLLMMINLSSCSLFCCEKIPDETFTLYTCDSCSTEEDFRNFEKSIGSVELVVTDSILYVLYHNQTFFSTNLEELTISYYDKRVFMNGIDPPHDTVDNISIYIRTKTPYPWLKNVVQYQFSLNTCFDPREGAVDETEVINAISQKFYFKDYVLDRLTPNNLKDTNSVFDFFKFKTFRRYLYNYYYDKYKINGRDVAPDFYNLDIKSRDFTFKRSGCKFCDTHFNTYSDDFEKYSCIVGYALFDEPKMPIDCGYIQKVCLGQVKVTTDISLHDIQKNPVHPEDFALYVNEKRWYYP